MKYHFVTVAIYNNGSLTNVIFHTETNSTDTSLAGRIGTEAARMLYPSQDAYNAVRFDSMNTIPDCPVIVTPSGKARFLGERHPR